jgi:hypothetical protein
MPSSSTSTFPGEITVKDTLRVGGAQSLAELTADVGDLF